MMTHQRYQATLLGVLISVVACDAGSGITTDSLEALRGIPREPDMPPEPDWPADRTGVPKAPLFNVTDHAGLRLRDGRYLAIGGEYVDSRPVRQLLAFDLESLATEVLVPPLPDPRYRHVAVQLLDGSVLVLGGCNDQQGWCARTAHAVVRSDPTLSSWRVVDQLAHGRATATATLLEDGRVLIVGGSGESIAAADRAEIFDPALDRIVPAGSPRSSRGAQAAVLLADGRVMVIGGGRNPNSTDLFDPVSGTWSTGPRMARRRNHPAAIRLDDGRVLVVGGYAGVAEPVAELWTPETDVWEPVDGITPRNAHVLVAVEAGALAVGGVWEDEYLTQTELFDVTSSTWRPGPVLEYGRTRHTATELDDGRVLVVGGWDGTGYPPGEVLEAPR